MTKKEVLNLIYKQSSSDKLWNENTPTEQLQKELAKLHEYVEKYLEDAYEFHTGVPYEQP